MAPTGAALPTARRLGRMASWWFRVRDMPEVLVLYGWLGTAAALAAYTTHRTLLTNTAGAYINVNMRGDPERQVETGRTGYVDPAAGRHSLWWHAAQVKIDDKGANVGVLWDNRTRPDQYSPAAPVSGPSLNAL